MDAISTGSGDADVLIERMAAVKNQWERARAEVEAGPSGVATAQALVADLRAELSLLAAALNTLDVDIRDRQDDYDRVYPRFERFIQAQRLIVTLPRPWHRNYALGNQPRLLVRYDFERRYAQALARALRELDEARSARFGGRGA